MISLIHDSRESPQRKERLNSAVILEKKRGSGVIVIHLHILMLQIGRMSQHAHSIFLISISEDFIVYRIVH